MNRSQQDVIRNDNKIESHKPSKAVVTPNPTPVRNPFPAVLDKEED